MGLFRTEQARCDDTVRVLDVILYLLKFLSCRQIELFTNHEEHDLNIRDIILNIKTFLGDVEPEMVVRLANLYTGNQVPPEFRRTDKSHRRRRRRSRFAYTKMTGRRQKRTQSSVL